MGMNRKTGRGAKFLIVFVVIVIIMAAVTFFAGKYAYHLLREYIEYASKQSTEVVLEKDGLKGMIEWMSEKEKEKLPKKFLVSDIEAELWKNGEVYDFAFNIQEFDESDEYMKDIYYTPSETQQSLFDTYADNIKEDRTPEDLLFQVMLDLGVLLSSKIEETTIAGKQVFNVADGFLIACFDNDVTEETVKAVAEKKPYYAVFRDSSMANDSVATNFDQIFASISPETVRKVL